jgi:hypothetical protein
MIEYNDLNPYVPFHCAPAPSRRRAAEFKLKSNKLIFRSLAVIHPKQCEIRTDVVFAAFGYIFSEVRA